MQQRDEEGQVSGLQTRDPAALGYLLSETLFAVKDKSRHIPEFPFHGGKDAGILFIARDAAHPWMPDAAMDAFQKSLAALKLPAGEVALVNIARIDGAENSFEPGPLARGVLSQFKPLKIILLGVQPERFGISGEQLPRHVPATLQGATWLYTYDFSEMLDDTDKKRRYWDSIKTFLG